MFRRNLLSMNVLPKGKGKGRIGHEGPEGQ